MLVLGRREGEGVILRNHDTKEEIIVTVTEIMRGKIRLGFVAGTSWTIYRDEIDPNKPKET